MTTFRFNTFNHCEDGKRCIEDLTAILSAQLRALGHATQASDDFAYGRDCVNVLYESFADPGVIPAIALAYRYGARFVYVATEEPAEEGFNGRLDNAMDERQRAFPEAAQYAEAVLHLAPGEHVTEWYSRYAPASYAELGCAPELIQPVADEEPERDFGFYGQMTPRRRRVFDELERATNSETLVLPFIEASASERDREMRRVRVIPQVRAHDSQDIISSSRCATALYLGRPVVAEPHRLPGAWADIVMFSTSMETFCQDAAYAARHWRELHATQLAQFAERMAPERCLGEPLRAVCLA